MKLAPCLTVLLALTPACKPRQTDSGLRADEGGKASVPADASAAAKQVEDACGKAPQSLFHAVVSGAVDYSAAEPAKSPGDKPVQTEWFERATFKDGKWHLSSAIRATSSPTYVVGRKSLSSDEFIAALGCSALDTKTVANEIGRAHV